MLHHSAQIFEVPLTLVTLVRTIRDVVSGCGPRVLKLGLGRQHVPGLLQHHGEMEPMANQKNHLVLSDEVVHPLPCSFLAWTVGTGTRFYMLNSIGLRPV